MAVVGAGTNRYYKKVSVDTNSAGWYDINASIVFGDLFDGNGTTANIRGGADYQTYISDMAIPEPDVFGDSSLVGLKMYTFPTSTTLNAGESLPGFKVWKSNTAIGNNNEGTITVNKRDLTVITALTDISVPWLYEPFTGGASEVTEIAGERLVSYGDPFISIDDAHTYQIGATTLSLAELSRRYGEPIEGGRRNVIFLEKKRVLGSRLVPSGDPWKTVGMIYGIALASTVLSLGSATAFITAAHVTYSKEWHPKHGMDAMVADVHFPNLPKSALKYVNPVSIRSDRESNAETSSTIFTDIYTRGNENYIDAEGNDLFFAKATLSTEKTFGEGQSLKMRTRWGIDAIPGAAGGKKIPDDLSYGQLAENRQEVCCVTEIPYPHAIDTPGSSTLRTDDLGGGEPLYVGDNAWGYTNQSISMDMYIDNMAPVFRASSDAHTHHDKTDYRGVNGCAIVRGFAVLMTRTKPQANESLWAFMARTTSPSASKVIKLIKDYEADSEEYRTATGVIIAKYPIDFGQNGTKINANLNLDREYLGDSPILAIPFTNQVADSQKFDTDDEGFYTYNLENKADDDGYTFHESIGGTLWYNAESNTDVKNMGVQLEQNNWFKLKFTFIAGQVFMQIRDSKTGDPLSVWLQIHSHTKGNQFFDDWSAPRHLSIWNYNFPGDATYTTDPDDVSLGVADFDAENILYIDNITYQGFNHIHTNSTVSENNLGTRGKIHIPATMSYIKDTRWDGIQAEDVIAYNPSYISIGFDTLAEFDKNTSGGAINLFFNDVAFTGDIEAIYHDSTNIAIRAGFTSNIQDERIGRQASHSFFTYEAGTPANGARGWPFVNKGLNTTGVANRGFDFETDGVTHVDKFSNKGCAILDFNSQTVDLGKDDAGNKGTPAKRENFFTSARVLDFSLAEQGTVIVDNGNIFNLDDDTEYVIYKLHRSVDPFGNDTGEIFKEDWGTNPTNEHGLVVKIKDRLENVITFNKDVRLTGHGRNLLPTSTIEKQLKDNPLCTDIYKNKLYISPLKYWITLEIRNTGATAGIPGSDRSYSSILTVNQSSNPPAVSEYGATFNESTYTDAATYLKRRNIRPGIDDTVIETQTNYGSGKMNDEDNLNGGYVTETIVEENLSSLDKWLVFNITPIVTIDEIEPGDIVSTMVAPTNSLNSSLLTIATSESTDKIVDETYGSSNTMRPFGLAIYEDDVPTIEDFSVMPNEDNPFFPDFEWTCDAEDAWYGFIIIDTELPSHQYHKSPLHLPCWRPLPSTENTFMHWPPSLDDSEADIIDYFNDNKYQYGFTRKNTLHSNGNLRPSSTTDKGTHTGGTIKDYTTFLDPEGLSGWCHNFNGDGDKLIVLSPEYSGSGDAPGSINGNQSSFVLHIRPDTWPVDKMGILWTGGAGGIDILLNSSGKVVAQFFYSKSDFVELISHTPAMKNGNPTNIIVTFDKDLTHGNCKLFLNGKLEDQSGRVLTAGSSTRWKTGTSIEKFERDTMGYLWSIGGGGGGTESFDGKMEEVVYYPLTIYPVNPAEGKFTWTKPVSDIDSNGKPISYFARLFVKDYHNIRGTTRKEVAMSVPVTVHKAGVSL